jgi:hypothetical protein
VRRRPERLVVFLGDVSGKGIPASMFMVRAISLARLLSREIAEPERILARLNDELAADNPSGMFVTFLCAMFEPQSARLAWPMPAIAVRCCSRRAPPALGRQESRHGAGLRDRDWNSSARN